MVVSPLKGDAPDFIDASFPIRKDTDAAMMLAMAHTLISENRYDCGFLERYCVGYEGFRDYLLGREDGVAKDANWAAAITGVSADKIRKLSRDAADAPSLITLAWSLQPPIAVSSHIGRQLLWLRCSVALACRAAALPLDTDR